VPLRLEVTTSLTITRGSGAKPAGELRVRFYAVAVG